MRKFSFLLIKISYRQSRVQRRNQKLVVVFRNRPFAQFRLYAIYHKNRLSLHLKDLICWLQCSAYLSYLKCHFWSSLGIVCNQSPEIPDTSQAHFLWQRWLFQKHSGIKSKQKLLWWNREKAIFSIFNVWFLKKFNQ